MWSVQQKWQNNQIVVMLLETQVWKCSSVEAPKAEDVEKVPFDEISSCQSVHADPVTRH